MQVQQQQQQQAPPQQPPQQQQQLTLQQAHDIGLAKGQQQSYVAGFVAAVIVCGGTFLLYKGACWAMKSSAPPAASVRRAAAVAAQ